ncbi:MAG: hypothetical protein EAZ82_12255 [Verrucomicrobia bacterium]|nr:MAG: hypothetical protein EAZ82_12255 [Verrucomicrobiota bacterium]
MTTPSLSQLESAATEILQPLSPQNQHELLSLLLQRRMADGQNGRPNHPVIIQILEPKIQMLTAK